MESLTWILLGHHKDRASQISCKMRFLPSVQGDVALCFPPQPLYVISVHQCWRVSKIYTVVYSQMLVTLFTETFIRLPTVWIIVVPGSAQSCLVLFSQVSHCLVFLREPWSTRASLTAHSTKDPPAGLQWCCRHYIFFYQIYSRLFP